MHGRMATYRYTGDAHELAQRAEEGMLPILEAQPGFRAYSLAATGDEVLSLQRVGHARAGRVGERGGGELGG